MQKKLKILLIILLSVWLIVIGVLVYHRQSGQDSYAASKFSPPSAYISSKDELRSYIDPTNSWSITVPLHWEVEEPDTEPPEGAEAPNFSKTEFEYYENDDVFSTVSVNVSILDLKTQEDQENFDFATRDMEEISFGRYEAFRKSQDTSTETHFSHTHALYIKMPQQNQYYALSGNVDTQSSEKLSPFERQVNDAINSFTFEN